MVWILAVWMFLSSPPVKQEVEIRVGRQQVPEAVLAWIDPVLKQSDRVRYFRQTDGEERTYEVKFQAGPNRWSVEFHSDGSFKEAELLIGPDALPSGIIRHLDAAHPNWRITRAQSQHEPIGEWHIRPGDPIGYEIEIETHGGRLVGRIELTFGRDGGFIEERRILEIPMDI